MSNGPTETEIKAAAKDAIEFARQHFQIILDYSDRSIEDVEQILGRFHDDLPKGIIQRLFRSAPSPEKISQTVVAFGSYVGEVLRQRLIGSRWELDTSSDRNLLSLTDGDKRVWPHTKVHRRVVNGPEENILHYFQEVIERWNEKN